MIKAKNNREKVTIALLRYCGIIYFHLRKNYLNFLPTSPLASSSLVNKKVFRLMTKLISSNFEPIIREELEWYAKVHYDILDY